MPRDCTVEYLLYVPSCTVPVYDQGAHTIITSMQRVLKSQSKGPKAGSSKSKAMPKAKPQPSRPVQGFASKSTLSRGATSLFHRLRDKDLIVNVVDPASNAGAAVRIPPNPRFWPNTRAYQESLGWQTYTPHSIRVRWLPSVAVTTSGQIVGGTIYKTQTLSSNLIANALLTTAHSYAGPIWEPCQFEMDLSSLTQPKYLLNDTEEDGVPCDLFIILPSTAVGILSIEYDISFFGHSTAPTSVPVYDLVPRYWTSPADLTTTDGTMSSTVGITYSNGYHATIACGTTTGDNVKLTPTSGGGGPIAIDCSFFNSEVSFYIDSTGKGAFKEASSTNLYLHSASMENQQVFIWLNGPAN